MGTSWFARHVKRATKKQRATSAHPRIEVLEDRLVLATRTWDGNALSNNWSNRFNWAQDIAPVAGDDIVFPAGQFNDSKVADNDLPAGTSFRSITFQGGGFVVKGNRITLGVGGIVNAEKQAANFLKMDIVLSGSRTIQVGKSSNLFLQGSIGGTPSSFSLTKTGEGNVALEGNNSYAGQTIINGGQIIARHENALGSSSQGTTVGDNGRLYFEDKQITRMKIKEPIQLANHIQAPGAQRQLTFDGGIDIQGAISLGNGSEMGVFGNIDMFGQLTEGLGSKLVTGLGTFEMKSILTLTSDFNIEVSEKDRAIFSETIKGNGGFIHSGRGTIVFNGNDSNVYTGFTGISGKVILDKSFGAVAIPGDFSAENIEMRKGNQIRNTSHVAVHGDFNMNGNSNTIASLTLSGDCNVDTRGVLANGTLKVNGPITGAAFGLSSTAVQNFYGDIELGNATQLIHNDVIMFINANLHRSNANTAIAVDGDGILSIKSNGYTGQLIINDGRVDVDGNLSKSNVVVQHGEFGGRGTIGSLVVQPGAHLETGTAVDFTAKLKVEGDVTLLPGSIWTVHVNNPIAGLGFDQLNVNGPGNSGPGSGTITVEGAILNAEVGLGNAIGDNFRILNNDDNDPVVGRFASASLVTIPQGGSVTASTGEQFKISYSDGIGSNDILLTRISASALFPNRSITPVIVEGGVATLTGIVSDPDRRDSFILHINWGDGSPVETKVYPPSFHGKRVYFRHRYLESRDEPYQIELNWHDQRGEGSSDTLTTLVTPTARTARTTDAIFASLVNLREKKNLSLLGS